VIERGGMGNTLVPDKLAEFKSHAAPTTVGRAVTVVAPRG
jgi:hypothetical protein